MEVTLLRLAGGDARRALTYLEESAAGAAATGSGTITRIVERAVRQGRHPLRPRRRPALRRDQRVHQVDPRVRRAGRAALPGPDDRGRGGPAFHRPPAGHPAPRGHRAGRPDRADHRGRRRRGGRVHRHAGGPDQPRPGGDRARPGAQVERGGDGDRRGDGRRAPPARSAWCRRTCATPTTPGRRSSGTAGLRLRPRRAAGIAAQQYLPDELVEARYYGPPTTGPRRPCAPGWTGSTSCSGATAASARTGRGPAGAALRGAGVDRAPLAHLDHPGVGQPGRGGPGRVHRRAPVLPAGRGPRRSGRSSCRGRGAAQRCTRRQAFVEAVPGRLPPGCAALTQRDLGVLHPARAARTAPRRPGRPPRPAGPPSARRPAPRAAARGCAGRWPASDARRSPGSARPGSAPGAAPGHRTSERPGPLGARDKVGPAPHEKDTNDPRRDRRPGRRPRVRRAGGLPRRPAAQAGPGPGRAAGDRARPEPGVGADPDRAARHRPRHQRGAVQAQRGHRGRRQGQRERQHGQRQRGPAERAVLPASAGRWSRPPRSATACAGPSAATPRRQPGCRGRRVRRAELRAGHGRARGRAATP